MELITTNSWNDSFFTDFLNFKTSIHKDIITSFPETLDDYKKYFSSDSVFSPDFDWRGFIIKKDSRIIAQAILCWKRGTKSGNLGFIDWLNDSEAAKFLLNAVEESSKKNHLTSLKTPIDMNFFVKYRIRLPSDSKPVYGEPIYPDYYHALYKTCGYTVVGQWDTYQVKRWAGIKDFFLKRRELSKKTTGGHTKSKDKRLKTTIRCVRMKEWEKELRVIYDLFSKAYCKMPEFESLSFDQFKQIYDDFRYVINPLYSYIVELHGKPVGFCINYVDPLPILVPLKGKKLSMLQKALVLLRLRLNNGTYLISHVGKIPGPNGEEIKGVQIQVSNRITLTCWYMRRLVVTFQNVNSPSRRTWNPDVFVPHASYVLYGKDL